MIPGPRPSAARAYSWDQVRDIVLRALPCATRERDDLLERTCGQNHALRVEVEGLLDRWARASRFLEGTRYRIDPGFDGTWPRRIGRFEISGLLGRGGMGVVYRAQQERPRRDVALKIVPGGAFVDDRRLRLFKREIATLGRLNHPGIATIYEAGCTPQGQHYFALELVEGLSLSAYLRTHEPTVVDRLTLFGEICAAIQYAHQRGVIHRDLKPGNILVDSAGHPKVLDFGLAQITAAEMTLVSSVGGDGGIQGTLAYMSPEQAAGRIDEIDVRCDVYALGVILYEMLTGQRPHDLEGCVLGAAVQRICHDAIPRPSSLVRDLRGDLETILLKALEKEPQQRYGSVAEFGEDVERFVSGRPIMARPHTLAYEVRTFTRRHRTSCVVAAAVCAAVGVSWVFTIAQWRRAAREASTANAVVNLLMDGLKATDPNLASTGQEYTLSQFLTSLEDRVDHHLGDRPGMRAAVHRRLGATFAALGHFDKAEAQCTKALQYYRATRGPDDPVVGHQLVALGWNLHEQTRYAEARRMFEEAMDTYARAGLAADGRHARAEEGLADILCHLGDYDAARRHGLNALRRYQAEGHHETGQMLVILSTIEHRAGRLEQAERYAREAIQAHERTPSTWASRQLARMHLGAVLLAAGKCVESEETLEAVVAQYGKLLADDHPNVLLSRSRLGASQACQERWHAARETLDAIDLDGAGWRFLDPDEAAEAFEVMARVYAHEHDDRRISAIRVRQMQLAAAP